MPKKEFKQAPKPTANRAPSDEAVAAFEKNGIGQASNPQTHIPAKAVEPLTRISVDIPKSEHIRFKTACSANGTTMVAELKTFIQAQTQRLEQEAGIHSR